jgi:hypothetical protein
MLSETESYGESVLCHVIYLSFSHGCHLSGWGAVQAFDFFIHLGRRRKVERFARDIADALGTIKVLGIFFDNELDMPAA